MSSSPVPIAPGRGLGWITLGSSLHSVISTIKSQPQTYPKIDLSYSSTQPILQPVILNVPENGLRLRFDGPNQHLRLIEVLDFSKTTLSYKGIDLIKHSRPSEADQRHDTLANPSFRHVYNRLFGPAYEGEYTPPDHGRRKGTYALSYPGLAFLFPVDHKSWSDKADFVSMLSSTATSPATSMAIFAGSSWPEVRSSLFDDDAQSNPQPQASEATADWSPAEIDEFIVIGAGRIDCRRRNGIITTIQLGMTTPQDLVAEFGPPDAIYRKNDNKISIHATQRASSRRGSSISPALDAIDADRSSMQSYSEASEAESQDASAEGPATSVECFYNYFHHGFDVLISYPTTISPAFPGTIAPELDVEPTQPVVTKIMLHGNIPGSHCFNRHRRCRWVIQTPDASGALTSEMPFNTVAKSLNQLWHETYANAQEEKQLQRGMVLNRGWGESPDSSMEILGGFEESAPRNQDQTSIMSNTELFGFPGMLFEVLKNDAISCLTVY